MAGQMNYDYDVENADLLRRQKMVDAMQSGALQPLQMPTTPGARVSPLAVLQPILQAYLSAKMGERVKSDRTALTERYNNDLSEGMKRYYETANGGPVDQPAQGPMPDGSAVQGMITSQQPGNPRQAIADALASNHPVLKDFAMKQMAEQQKGAVTPKDLLPYAAPSSVLGNPNDPSTWKPKANLQEVGGVVYDPESKAIIPLNGPAPQQKTVNGDLYELNPSTQQWKKLDNAPKVTTSVSLSPTIAGQKAGMEAYWKGAGQKVDALGTIAAQATNNKQTISELRNLDKNGIFSNTQSGPATFLSNMGQGLGIPVDTNKLGNTETYNALTTELWQGLVSKYGGNRGVTAEEAKEIKKMLPLAANSPQARQQLFNILDNLSDRQITQYNNANQSFAKAVKMDDPSMFANELQGVFNPLPTQPSPTTQVKPKAPTVSNW